MTVIHPPAVQTATDSADTALSELWRPLEQRTAGLPFVARDSAEAAADLVASAVRPGRLVGEHVHLANAYSVAIAEEQRSVAEVFTGERAWLLPDGRPLVWLSALRRDRPRLRQVRGPQLMLDVADLGRAVGLRHFLLGGSPDVLGTLEANLGERFPGIEIVGSFSPPFRPATKAELADRDAMIRNSGAQVVWVGLGTPKQDLEAARLASDLPVVAVAVGAAFDYAAGRLRPAPRWISLIGMEWFWRFVAEPRRLWRRYTVGNLRFIRAVLAPPRGPRHERKDPPTRVAVVGQLPPPLHGSAVMTERLIEALTGNGLAVEVVDRRFSRSVGEVGRPTLRKVVAAPSLIARFLVGMRRSERLVLLLTSSPGSFLLDRLLLSLTRRPAILYIHTTGYRELAARSPVWRHLVRGALRRADRVVVLGDSLIEDVQPFVARSGIAVVPNTTAAVPARTPTAGHRVLFLSNLVPGKGADVFVRTARALLARNPELPWRFDLAGTGDATALGELPDAVTVHGTVTGDTKAALLAEADVLIVPSTYAMEAQPLVIVEALSYGVPVVAYDNGGIRDLVDASVGALVPAGNEAALAAAVLEVLSSARRRQAASTSARDRFERQHSPEVYAHAWRSVLRSSLPHSEEGASA